MLGSYSWAISVSEGSPQYHDGLPLFLLCCCFSLSCIILDSVDILQNQTSSSFVTFPELVPGSHPLSPQRDLVRDNYVIAHGHEPFFSVV